MGRRIRVRDPGAVRRGQDGVAPGREPRHRDPRAALLPVRAALHRRERRGLPVGAGGRLRGAGPDAPPPVLRDGRQPSLRQPPTLLGRGGAAGRGRGALVPRADGALAPADARGHGAPPARHAPPPGTLPRAGRRPPPRNRRPVGRERVLPRGEGVARPRVPGRLHAARLRGPRAGVRRRGVPAPALRHRPAGARRRPRGTAGRRARPRLRRPRGGPEQGRGRPAGRLAGEPRGPQGRGGAGLPARPRRLRGRDAARGSARSRCRGRRRAGSRSRSRRFTTASAGARGEWWSRGT